MGCDQSNITAYAGLRLGAGGSGWEPCICATSHHNALWCHTGATRWRRILKQRAWEDWLGRGEMATGREGGDRSDREEEEFCGDRPAPPTARRGKALLICSGRRRSAQELASDCLFIEGGGRGANGGGGRSGGGGGLDGDCLGGGAVSCCRHRHALFYEIRHLWSSPAALRRTRAVCGLRL